MPKFWDRLRAMVGGKSDAEPADAGQPRASWVGASENPFGVPVLDLISITGNYLSTTSDPANAQRAVSWASSVGDELDSTPLDDAPERRCALRYPADPLLADGLLYCPREMEHKWVIALRGEQILLARSWTGEVASVARARREGDALVVDAVRVVDGSGFDTLGDPLEIVDWLLRSHALEQELPLPVNDVGAALLESTPLLAMSRFGYMARWAAKSWDPPSPSRPLRSYSRVMQAVRADDLARVRVLGEAGEALDSPSPTGGLRPLAVAVIKNDPALVKLLLELGADPNLGDDRNMVPLGRAVVHGGDEAMLDMLVAAGARTDAVNSDGFGLLHAVAEVGRAELVAWMIDHGLELERRTRHGHTPLHIACALGHLDTAAALLDSGADARAEAKGQDALAIAREEGRSAVVEMLSRRADRA